MPTPEQTPEQIYLQAFKAQSGDAPGRAQAQKYLSGSTAIYHDNVITMGYLPKVYNLQTLAHFKNIAEETASILAKVTRFYLDDANYRKLFGFPELLERLICLESCYAAPIPIMRVDIFYDEATGNFQFCEFNTDGSSAMNEDREICNALALTPSFAAADEQLRLCGQELFDPWVEVFLENYAEWRANISERQEIASSPTIAIVDYRESATIYELEEFRRRFSAAGYRCLVCDIPDLRYSDGVL
jgi:hypothetical protein